MKSFFQSISWAALVMILGLIGTDKVCSQSLSIQAVGNSADNNTSTFSLVGGEVRFGSGQVSFRESASALTAFRDVDVSPDRALLAALKTGSRSASRALLMHPSGDTLSAYDAVSLSAGDPSVAVYASNSGTVLVRDNIANFNFYDPLGALITNVSASSESKGGETISEVAADPDWNTVVLYVPKIKRGGEVASQAQVLTHRNQLKSLFYSKDRSIKSADVSADGQFVTLVTEKAGTGDRIHIMDRHGNDLNVIPSDETLTGAKLSVSSDGAYITAWSQKRVLVLDAITGERLGSTSFSSPVMEVSYFPEDDLVLALTADYDAASGTGVANNVQFHAIDLRQRKVQRQDYGSALGFTDAIDVRFTRNARHDYTLIGTSKELRLRVSF